MLILRNVRPDLASQNSTGNCVPSFDSLLEDHSQALCCVQLPPSFELPRLTFCNFASEGEFGSHGSAACMMSSRATSPEPVLHGTPHARAQDVQCHRQSWEHSWIASQPSLELALARPQSGELLWNLPRPL